MVVEHYMVSPNSATSILGAQHWCLCVLQGAFDMWWCGLPSRVVGEDLVTAITMARPG